MEFKDLLETRINADWTYWSVAILALGGWLFTAGKTLSGSRSLGVAIGAVVFFLANLGVLWSATRLVIGVREDVALKSQSVALSSSRLAAAFKDASPAWRLELTLVLHLAIHAVALWTLLAR